MKYYVSKRVHKKQKFMFCTFALLVFVVFVSYLWFKRDFNRYHSNLQEINNSSQETIHLVHSSLDLVSTVSQQLAESFVDRYKKKAGIQLRFDQVFADDLQQARNVALNLPADLVSSVDIMNLELIHIRKNENNNLLAKGWQSKYPNESSPAKTTLAFMVRKNNPKNIREWKDLVRSDIEVLAPDYRSFDGKHIIENAFVYAMKWYKAEKENKDIAISFVQDLMDNTIVLNEDSHGVYKIFLEEKRADVLITYETHANRMLHSSQSPNFDIVSPPYSMKIEVFVAVVERNLAKMGRQKRIAAEAFWNYVYSAEGQKIVAENYFRPVNISLLKDYRKHFPKIELFNRKEVYVDGMSLATALYDTQNGIITKLFRKRYIEF